MPISPVRPNSRNSFHRQLTPRADAKVHAFNRGKDEAYSDALDFCRHGLNDMGEEILHDVRSEMSQLVETIRSDLTDALDVRQRKADAKMEAIWTKVQYMSATMAEEAKQQPSQQALVDQAEANRKLAMRREDQITHMTEQIRQIHDQMKHVENKIDMDGMVDQFLSRLDLQRVIDLQMAGIAARFKELAYDIKAQTADLGGTMEEVRKHFNRPVTVDFGTVIAEMQKGRDLEGEDFHAVMTEIAKVQQALNMDYAKIRQSGRNQATSASPKPSPKASPVESEESTLLTETAKHARDFRRIPRVREFWSQTESDRTDSWAQTSPEVQQNKKKQKKGQTGARDSKGEVVPPSGLADAEAMKEKAKKALMRPQYNVFDYYYSEGICQAVAKSTLFDNITVGVVCLNAIWIAIDTDYNNSADLSQAGVLFQAVEHTFVTYFFLEISVRFLAFEYKTRAFRDFWFCFDSLLVLNMVVESWILPLVFMALSSDTSSPVFSVSMLRMMRMVKLIRISRITRFLRAIPELVIILKAIGFAARSVAVFFLLWIVIIYVFAIILRQLTDQTDLGSQYFGSVGSAMNTLLLEGILADYADMVNAMGRENPLYGVVMVAFVLLASITIMYMLVGVLVEVVGVIATAEKEGLTVSHVSQELRDIMINQGRDVETPLNKYEFQQFLIEPEVAQILAGVDVDVVVLLDTTEFLFEDLEKKGMLLTFEKMIDIVLNGRGSNNATVKDIDELQRVVKQSIASGLGELDKAVRNELRIVQANVQQLRDEAFTEHVQGGREDTESELDPERGEQP
eukprot:TRINITY_DN24301_c0_g1_i1.p1 TRINITY_DN24301_c0_g1~~TRINITY_DN24301_c0_g1_i1.p1  ORF type:complete len:797 (+),score=172.77 TRINITY_DN24301_c0_g1_i1:59-2449(+)